MKKTLFTDGWIYGLKRETKRPVFLPHDAMQLQEREPEAKSSSGGAWFPGGIYTYEKRWIAGEEYADQRLILHFEGVYRNTLVRVNGMPVGGKHYGYAPFWLDIKDAVKIGEENLIEVEADNSEIPNSRWYTGGGIYRPVWLLSAGAVCIQPCGIKIKTVSIDPAVIRISVETNAAEIMLQITDHGKVLLEETAAQVKREGENPCDTGREMRQITREVILHDAVLWDEDHPHLYTCQVAALQNGIAVDSATTDFGIRMITCSPEGLYVNGKETLLRGGCMHSDNGILGAASFPEAEYRKVRILKKAGFNAIRCAHNPASPSLLDACDRLGIYVMDEGWDMWYKRKTRYDYAIHFMEGYEEDIRAMVDTDYNHPSVIMYSIGNEISEPGTPEGIELAGKLADGFRCLDDTRLITVGCNITILAGSKAGNETFDPDSDGTIGEDMANMGDMDSTKFNEMASQAGTMMEDSANSPEADEASIPVYSKVDIAGYNYACGRYQMDGELHPDRVIVGSETFPQNIYRNWGYVKEMPYVIGDFMWTAMDYIGEAGIGAWSYDEDGTGFIKPYPWLLGDTGALDLIGTPTGELFLARAAWGQLEIPVISVRPDLCYPDVIPAKGAWRGTNSIEGWSFRGCEGRETTVEVYSCGAKAELLINGISQGRKDVTDGIAEYVCCYEPGMIEAVSYDDFGRETGRSILRSAQGALSLRLRQEPETEHRKAGSVVYVTVEVVGENGVTENHADQKIRIRVEGGTLLGFGSARARTPERFTEGGYTTYYGRALAAVLTGKETNTVIYASSEEGLQGSLVIEKEERRNG